MESNIHQESGLKFVFPEENTVIKFDDTRFYRECFNKMPGSKGVDFISTNKNQIAFIEVKNCTGDEGNCRWRIHQITENERLHIHQSISQVGTAWILK